MAAAATDQQAATLAKCVERETLVGPEQFAFGRLDRTWRRGDEALEEFPEGALADEADTGAVGFVEHRESRTSGALADGAFFQLSKRHQRAGEVLGGDGMQEVALVLGGVAGFMELRFAVGRRDQSGVVPCGEA